jgi:hypothetical protein
MDDDDFEREGVVSVWVFPNEVDRADAQEDVLMELCGVEEYDLEFQEVVPSSDGPETLASLFGPVSYSSSFIHEALSAADRLGINEAFGVVVQFDFAYDPTKVRKPVAKNPVFIGYFHWEPGS